jgi:hypothetical protein
LGTTGLNALGARTFEQKMSTCNIPIIILILCPTHPRMAALQFVGYIPSIYTNKSIYNLVYRMIMKRVFCETQSVVFFTFICPRNTSVSLGKYNQQDATFPRSIYFYNLLYMFQAASPPIIRSTKLYIQHQVLSNQYCCLLLSWMRWNSISSTIAVVFAEYIARFSCVEEHRHVRN